MHIPTVTVKTPITLLCTRGCVLKQKSGLTEFLNVWQLVKFYTHLTTHPNYNVHYMQRVRALLVTLDCVRNPAQSHTEPLHTGWESNPQPLDCKDCKYQLHHHVSLEASVKLKIQNMRYKDQQSGLSKQVVGSGFRGFLSVSSHIQKPAPAIGSWRH